MKDLWQEPAFRSFVEAMNETVFTLDAEGRISGCICPSGTGLIAAPAEAIGQPYTTVIPERTAQAFGVALQALTATGAPQRVDFQMTCGRSRRYFAAKLGRLVRDGEAQGTLVIVWDVTEQALAHKARLRTEAVYTLLARHSSDVISLMSLEGRVVYLSPSLKKLTGFESEGMLGRRAEEIIHPDDLRQLQAGFRLGKLSLSERAVRVRHRLRRAEGGWIWVETDACLIEWEGSPAFLTATRDVSDRQVVEEQAALMLEELKQSRTRAEAANAAKSEFLANMSHSFRTPLHGILGMADLLEQSHLTDDQRQYVDAVEASGKVLLSLLDDLQDLSKIEADQLDILAAPFDLVEAVESLGDILASQAVDLGVELNCHVATGVPTTVVGDARRLRQVLINLTSLGLRNAERGELSVLVQPGEGGILRFSVGESRLLRSGVELPPSAGESPSSARERHSIGLTVARRLLELMGSTLRYQSTPGSAGLFAFDLRLPTADAPVETGGPHLKGVRVLVAETAGAVREWIREELERAGAEVELASGGVEVIRTLRDEPTYGCVILDSALPDIDGSALVSIIRAHPSLARLPLVLTSSVDALPGAPPKEHAEVNALLRKPLRRETLIRAVHEVVTSGCYLDGEVERGQDRTVLVVEDNLVNLRLARDVLRRAGYRVLAARDGRRALDQLRDHPVDAVLMDIQLPDMDGLQATAQIREMPGCSAIPIIAMTAHAMKGDAERFISAGLDDYLSKPVERRELLEVLARQIAKRRHSADSTPASL